MINGLGLRLVDIEQRLNISLGLDQKRHLSFHTHYIAEGHMVLPGFRFYSVLMGISMSVVMIAAMAQLWFVLTLQAWHLWERIGVIGVLVLLNISALANMLQVERTTFRLKQKIVKDYTMSNKASEANSEPAQKAASPAPQG